MRSGRGVTLLELLVVVLIIGVLAAIAVPQFMRQRGSAYVASMKSDLRNLVTAQETFKADSEGYAGALAALPTYRASAGVSIVIVQATNKGWAAKSSHHATTRTCVIYVGVGVARSGEPEGEPICD